jgi:hypothetical protein
MVKFKFEIFETIGPFYGDILKKKVGLETVDDFLQFTSYGRNYKPLLDKLEGQTLEKRKSHSKEQQEINEEIVRNWGCVFDLFRVPMVSPRDAEMLVATGIHSVQELSYKDADQVLDKMWDMDEDTYFIIVHEPTIADVEQWIAFAKMIIRRHKYGIGIPLVSLEPVMTLNYASEFQKFRIWTIEDLNASIRLIPGLYARIGMPRKTWVDFLGLCDLCRVDGIDAPIARALGMAGITSLDALRSISPDELKSLIDKVIETKSEIMNEHPSLVQDLSPDNLDRIVAQAKAQQITTTFMEVAV